MQLKDMKFMIFDVESIGLHGEAWAVGWVLMDSEGEITEEHLVYCDPSLARGRPENYQWVLDNCHWRGYKDYCDNSEKVDDPGEVCSVFWECWLEAQNNGFHLLADVAWPVEARFLIACIDMYPNLREWKGPFPLLDLSSIVTAQSNVQLERPSSCMPVHNPLADARFSALELTKYLSR